MRSANAPELTADAWNELAARSRVLVHHVSCLLGTLTHPTESHDEIVLAPIAGQTGVALEALLAQMSAAPELAAHGRTIQRLDVALSEWRRSIADASPVAPRYQRALLQHAAHAVTSCLHVEALSASESARTLVTRHDLGTRIAPTPP